MTPIVSIITPSFNRADLLIETANSIFQQTYPYWEWVVVDDGSTDDTASLFDKWTKEDHRVRFFHRHHEPRGACSCRNIGLKHARGEYVIFLDSDDLLNPTCLKQRIEVFQFNNDLDFIVFQGVIFNSINEKRTYWNIDTGNYLENFFNFNSTWQTSGPIWKTKSLLNNSLNWDENLAIWQDVDFHINALLKKMKFKLFFEMPHDYYIRQDSGNSVSRKNLNEPVKLISRQYFFNKYYSQIDLTIPPWYLYASFFSLLKIYSYHKDFNAINYFLSQGVQKNIICNKVFKKLKFLFLFNKLFNANFLTVKWEKYILINSTIGKIILKC